MVEQRGGDRHRGAGWVAQAAHRFGGVGGGPSGAQEVGAEAVGRLRDPARAATTVSTALLDQRALAGIGNIWRNETLFHERVDPWL
ncbi:MAG TPA: hypothetical protein VFJ71_09190, partial [Candidatus Limnocylindrales bacterium]|nr:hypothetical protein [Candidatus Limnocylindrales bacterium]